MHWTSVDSGFSFYFDYMDYYVITWMRFNDFSQRPTVRMSSFFTDNSDTSNRQIRASYMYMPLCRLL